MLTSEAPAPRQSTTRTVFAGLIGNVLEWFDYAVFGYFTAEIGANFFPGNADKKQLNTWIVFAIGFFMRPLGSVVLGRIGDRIGRRALLTLSIALMGGATLCIGVLPTYAQVGALAPALLVLMRMVQGFSLGGEFTGSMVYTTELARPWMRGLVSSSTAAGTTLGYILGSGTAWLIGHQMSEPAKLSWGWRVPFIVSIVFCIAGWLLRRGLRESEEGETVAGQRPALWPSLMQDWKPIVHTFGIVALTNAAYYLTFTFAVEYRKTHPGADHPDFQAINTLVLFAVLFAKPLGGWLSDRVGRRRLMIGLTVAIMAILYVAFGMMTAGSAAQFMTGQLLLALPIGMALGLQGAMVVEIFPLRTRVTSMSFAYSVTLAMTGAIAPYIATWLIDNVKQPMAPVYYTLVYGVIGLAIMLPMQETNKRSLTA